MNNIFLYQTNEHIFLNIYSFASFRDIFYDKNWFRDRSYNTLALIFLTAILGVFFARVQGIQTLKSGLLNLYQNKIPIYELISGASIAFAALLLIIPGFLTDLIGFILLIPFTRRILFRIIFKKSDNR